MKTDMPPYGPNPWHQTSWDARAAGNFMAGGAGAGLLVFTALAGVQGAALVALVLGGLALIALGLFCVLLELGRPLRSFNVIMNPRTSWMSREAIAAGGVFAAGIATILGVAPAVWLAAALALVFVYCQARILTAAKGIPAWRDPRLLGWLIVTGLTEGGGIFLLTLPLHGVASNALFVAVALLVAARLVIWQAYRKGVDRTLAPGARLALDRAGRALLFAGTPVPLALLALILIGAVAPAQVGIVAAVAGLAAALAGAYAKLLLVTRAGFNQGFALAHLPVRGQPR
jgi:phenylacetyl-CoA:acceptor oxidoreductase subunit 2